MILMHCFTLILQSQTFPLWKLQLVIQHPRLNIVGTTIDGTNKPHYNSYHLPKKNVLVRMMLLTSVKSTICYILKFTVKLFKFGYLYHENKKVLINGEGYISLQSVGQSGHQLLLLTGLVY